MTDTTDAIRALLDEQERAWRAGDAEAFSRAMAPGVVFTNVVGLFSIGREGFEAQHRHIFATFYKGSTLRQTVERITYVRPDVAIVNTLTQVTGFGALPSAIPTSGGTLTTRLEQVLVREHGGWQIAAFHNVVVHPDAAAAAPPRGDVPVVSE
jgi:uncharacterized protein (TIGR02246 family)